MVLNTIAPKDSQVSRARRIAVRLEAARARAPCLCRCSDTSSTLEHASHLPLLVLSKPRCIFMSMRGKLNMPAWKPAAGALFPVGAVRSRPGTSCAERVGKSGQQGNDGRENHGLLLRRRRRDKAQPYHT
jgi:hypothetical protein